MKQDKSKLKQVGSLRKQAEKTLAAKSGEIRKKPAADMEKVAHELQVHQIELEMQNDELRKAQIEIEKSRTKYFELYDLAPVGYFTLNEKGIIKEANLSGAKMLNTPKSALLRKPFFLFVLPESRDAFYAHLKKVFDTGAKQTCELKLMRKDGPVFVLLESIAATGEGANFSQCLSAVSDITGRKQAEEESTRFASFPKLNPNPVLEVDPSGKITFHNDAAAAVLKKFNLSDNVSVFLPGDIKELLTGLKQKKEGQYNRELIIKDKTFEETIYLAPQFNSLRIYAVDITERKRAETALQESESKYRSLFANMISGFAYHQIVLNRNGKPVDYIFLEINTAFEKLTGLKRENIIGKRATEIIPGIENDPADWIRTYGNVAFTGKETAFENYSGALKKWFSVSAYSPQNGYFVAIFDDITERKRAEEALRESEERLRLSQRAAHVGTFDWNIQTGVNIWTPELEMMYGLQPGTFGKTQSGWEQLVHPDDRDEAVRKVNLAFQTGEPVEGEWRVIWPDGSLHWITGRWQVFKDKAGKSLRMTGVNLDITERKRFEEELQKANEELESKVRERTEELKKTYDTVESERQRLYSVLDKLPAYVCLLTADYKFAYVNRKFKRLFGDPGDRQCHEYLFGLRKPCEGCQTFRIFGENLSVHHWEWTGPNGKTYAVSDYPFTDIDGSPLILEMGIDITEQRRAAKALEESEHKYRMLIEQAADGIVILDRELNIVDSNTAACEMTGFTCQELLKLNAKELYPPGELEERPLRLDELLSGKTVTEERKATKKDGSLIEVEISAKLIEGGQVQAIVRDITGRKVEERKSRLITNLLALFAKKTSRKEYLDSVVQLLHDWTSCRSTGIRVVNKERYMPYDSYTGFSEEFMRKENMISLDADACACIRVINGKFEPQDAPAITPNGSFRLEDSIQFADQLTEKELSRFRGNCIRSGYASIAVIPIRYHDQPLGAIHLADEKKNMVTSETVQFLESLAAPLIGEAIYRFSTEEELTQHRNHLEEIVKERTRELHDIQADLNRAQTVAHTGSWRLDIRKNELLWSDENWRIFGIPIGTALTYETFLSTIHPDDREYVDKQWKAALQGEPYDIEHRIVVDGQVKWVREKAELEFDADGTLKGGFGTTQNITEKKQVERDLQTLMEELKRSNSDLEQFAYAASHDLQEPLRVVAGFIGLLEKKYKEKLDDKAHEYIEYAIDGVKRMQMLIKDLLAYSQVGTKGKTFKPTICSVALEQAIYNLHTAIEESSAEITYSSLPTVSADSSQLIRLFQNLIGNAIKFRGEERLKVHIAAEQKGNEWVFSIRDNGIGIDPKFFGRIFVVFQRLHTREEYEGTGIGLAVCKKIVERHGGHIWVESEQGKGTTFYFTMPVME